MKTRLLIILFASLIFFGTIDSVFAPPQQNHEDAFNYAEHVIIGKILSVEILSEPDVQISPNIVSIRGGIALYEIEVEEYLKNPLDTYIIKVPGRYLDEEYSRSTIDLLYEVDQRVFLYIQKDYPDALVDYDLIIRSHESRVLDEPICGVGATYQKGLCIIDKTRISVDPSRCWGHACVYDVESPLKQIKSGFAINEIQCRESLILVTKHDGSPACVKPVTKQHLIDRGWTKTKSLDEIQGNHDLIKQNIVRIEDGRIALYPENMCASIDLYLPTEQDIKRYKNDEKGLDDTNILQITSSDLKEIPNIQELIYAVHSIEFPYNKYSSAYLDGMTFVEYEFFLMYKSMKKYGDSQEDYFIKLDKDYEERFTNPAKQGFTNHFVAPLIVYNENVYSIDGIYFWTSDEHEPMRMGVYPKDTIGEDEKFITLTDEDMRSIPKIKEAIQNIGTVKESISAHKGLPEDQWNEYQEWFKQKSQDRLKADRFRLIQYDEQFYSVGFGIC